MCAPQRRLNLESGFCIPVLSDHSLYHVCDLGRILVPTVDLCIMKSLSNEQFSIKDRAPKGFHRYKE